jgi:hypothetical protein
MAVPRRFNGNSEPSKGVDESVHSSFLSSFANNKDPRSAFSTYLFDVAREGRVTSRAAHLTVRSKSGDRPRESLFWWTRRECHRRGSQRPQRSHRAGPQRAAADAAVDGPLHLLNAFAISATGQGLI